MDYCKHFENKKLKTNILCPLPKKTVEGCITDEFERKFIEGMDRDQKTDLLQATMKMDIPAL